jgi:hypothetical protein
VYGREKPKVWWVERIYKMLEKENLKLIIGNVETMEMERCYHDSDNRLMGLE